MFEIKFKITPTKNFNKEIENAIIQIIENLKKKFQAQNRELNYKTKVEKDALVFETKSDSYSATDFLAQLDKQIREELGKKFKTAIKEIEIISYVIEAELEEAPKTKFSIPFAEKLEFADKKVKIFYDNISFQNIKDQYVEKSIKLVKDKIKQQNYVGKDEFRDIVWEGKQRNIKYNGDPAIELEEKDWIKRTGAKGQFVFGREYTALMNVMKELLIETIYEPLGFYEMTFPKFEMWEITKKSGHAKNMYPNVYFVSLPKNASPEYWQEIMDLYAITGEIPEEKIKEKSDMVGIMSYAQCPPFWPYLKNKIVDEKNLPLLVYDWSGPTYRNESGGIHGLDRLEEFHRIETLFVGTKEQIIKTWQNLKDAFRKFYDETLDLELNIVKVTPWWMAHAGVRTEQGNEEVGTYDFETYLPYRGDRTKEWLEVGNDSSNGDKYPVAWNVKSRTQEHLWSGCAGTSFERILVSFLAQKGLDPKNWPKNVRERFEKKLKNIKPLKFY
jgi:seryl-tRNA synthetase